MSPDRAGARVCVLTPQGRGRWPSSGSGVRRRWRWPMRRFALGEALPWRSRRRDGSGSDGWGRGSAMRSWRSSSRASRPRSKCTPTAAPPRSRWWSRRWWPRAPSCDGRSHGCGTTRDRRSRPRRSSTWPGPPRSARPRSSSNKPREPSRPTSARPSPPWPTIPRRPSTSSMPCWAGRDVGLRLIAGWRVVLAGRPNVGKSRLLNALTGYDRAIVDATPGTTRDVVTARTALDGWPVELADTAGLRPSDDPIEASGVALARARQGEADLVLVVLDRSEPLTDIDRAIVAEHAPWPVRRQQVRPAGGLEPRGPRRGRGLGRARRWDRGTGRDHRQPARPRGPAPSRGVPFRASAGPPPASRPRRPRGGRSRRGGPQPGRDLRRASPPVRSGGLSGAREAAMADS